MCTLSMASWCLDCCSSARVRTSKRCLASTAGCCRRRKECGESSTKLQWLGRGSTLPWRLPAWSWLSTWSSWNDRIRPEWKDWMGAGWGWTHLSGCVIILVKGHLLDYVTDEAPLPCGPMWKTSQCCPLLVTGYITPPLMCVHYTTVMKTWRASWIYSTVTTEERAWWVTWYHSVVG